MANTYLGGKQRRATDRASMRAYVKGVRAGVCGGWVGGRWEEVGVGMGGWVSSLVGVWVGGWVV